VNFSREANKRPTDAHDINGQIRAPIVRVTGVNGEMLGELATARARELADEAGLDLVVTNPGINPPLARIVDYGKFKYELSQREKDQKRKNRENAVDTKEIQLRPVTDTNDLNIKAKRAIGFLEDGDKVKVVVKFKGREMSHREMGQKVMDSFTDAVGHANFKVDSPLAMNGKQMLLILAPIKKAN